MLYLMRHGETEWNRIGRMQGRLNSPLTAKGRSQAEALGRIMNGREVSVLSSPQGRALHTAGIAFGAGHTPIRTDDRLMEIDVGEFSGELREDLAHAHPHLFEDSFMTWYDHAPGGEGYVGLEARCRSLLDELSSPVALVTHGITLRMLRSLALCGTTELLAEGDRIAQGVVWLIQDGECHRLTDPTA